ncbi:acetyltransferase [Pleomorphomonas oryzae]|uniref:acetyltransferase n=1 Tax=Pleomorphomonas oryzae TaxID=261934 RepID=UPI00047B3381|nr:acetyltransferase [Pleomorphomonas oryzae]
MSQKVILAGNAITAEIISAYLRQDARFEVEGFVVDDEFVTKGSIEGYRTVGLSEVVRAFAPDTHRVIMAMGYNNLNRTRETLFERLKAAGYGIETYIHPDARIYTNQALGEGSVVLPGAVIEPHARVGANTMVWSNVTLAHHSSVGDHCWVAAGTAVSGQAKVLRNTFLGVSCTVVNAVTVEEYNVIGASALISRDTKPYSVHLARSAEPFRYSSEDYIKHFGI